MYRFGIYILTALITFGIGSLAASIFHHEKKTETKEIVKEKSFYDFFTNKTPRTAAESPPTTEERQAPFCRDKRILPVWNLIKNDEYFRERSGVFQNPDCSDMFEVLRFDLNQDGSKEIILRGKTTELCGAVGNCGFWIFGKIRGQYRKLLSSSDYVDITKMGEQILRTKTNGYFDILLKGHLNAADTDYVYYKFDGAKYKEGKCLVNAHIPPMASANPKWKFITCRDYAKREGF